MLNNTTEKLASIQSKIETINERLEAGRLYSVSSSCESESMSVFERTRSLFRLAMEKQTFYAHFFKLLALFCIAVAHLVYMQSFLDAYSALEDYNFKLHLRYSPVVDPITTTTTAAPPLDLSTEATIGRASLNELPSEPLLDDAQRHNLRLMSDQMDLLANYKRNNWICVAFMCIGLCSSSFFLFILPITEVCKRREVVMGIVDLVSFSAIPVLLTSRIFIVQALNETLAVGMKGAHKLLPASRLLNILQCTIQPREKLSYCWDVVLGTIFPIILLKYLIILALLTLAYIVVAYLIEWCIRHWFPHKHAADRKCRKALRHACCVCTPKTPKSVAAYNRCPSMSSIRPLRQYQNRTYVPVLGAAAGDSKGPILTQPLISVNPHLIDEESRVEAPHSDPIPAEPVPNRRDGSSNA